MSKRKYPEKYADETGVIARFEEYEEELGVDFGEAEEDFLPWFECFREGFIVGGCS